ncbi:KRI1-like family-domain-containing protein [Phialemonium atrogriseum]|uniref:KRI1-like family-domain-containing protein n=1 Tax=Phialemonium atrogriseum TaxID=1093897 RepID=A0AAJ0FN22_9PEZI|nr:KRI1-like family-domain-containing protein [Phialemonium atrogriseum]KAK1768494.1 KRI1-like family-domain-containing protein [Phialemonium atrogriseum]
MVPAAGRGATKGGPIPKKSLFDNEGSSSEDDQEEGGAALGPSKLKINEEYARRFEHNKKREDLHRLEEKYKSNGGASGSEDESSSDETEDDEGFLVTEDLDAEISATLQAIKNKDPRIYDKSAVFYKPFDPATGEGTNAQKEKPVFLRDYHRERYLRGDIGADGQEEDDANNPTTYTQEQEEIKQTILSEINAAAAADEEWSGDEAFMKPKEQARPTRDGVHPSRAAALELTEQDVVTADKDPETYLSKFMASKAWASEGGSRWEAFESDEGEDDNNDIAEQFEQAYNLRFEDPEKSNEVLKSYSRDVVAARSVRKEELTGRKKQRLVEKERKEAEKREREEDRRRLRRLKLEEAQEKLQKIKQAAGVSGKVLEDKDWVKFLNDAWEDDRWEEEMKRRFGEEYYAQADELSGSDDEDVLSKKTKPKKPKWDDDIDVKDIIPDFDDEVKPVVTLTDSEAAPEEGAEDESDSESESERPAKKRKTTKEAKKDRAAAKREARQELARLEALVDAKMELDNPRALSSSSKGGGGDAVPAFRYRETSPVTFGMTARDILLAPDSALNEYAGLKKLATFRDVEKKRKDRKRLGKKARLRQWRREVFGREFERTGPTFGFAEGDDQDGGTEAPQPRAGGAPKEEEQGANVVAGGRKKKRKRSKGKKVGKA